MDLLPSKFLLFTGVGPSKDELQVYGLNPARVQNPGASCQPNRQEKRLVSLPDRIVNQEAMLIAFVAEHSLSLSMTQPLTELAQALSGDKKALAHLKMARTTASYKLKHGLAKTFNEELASKLSTEFFSLNIDEAFSDNLHKVLTLLVQYPDDEKGDMAVSMILRFLFLARL